jgi:hypothetical protein
MTGAALAPANGKTAAAVRKGRGGRSPSVELTLINIKGFSRDEMEARHRWSL